MNHLHCAFAFILLLSFCAPSAFGRTPYTRGDEGLNITQRRYRLNHPDVTPKLLSNLGDFRLITNDSLFRILAQTSEMSVQRIFEPKETGPSAKAAGQAQALAAGNAAGEVARSESTNAIDYCGRFLKNFTVQPDSKWNTIRDTIFVPMAFLLLLPGAVLTQLRATIAAASPVTECAGPFEGLQRSLIAVFLIPGTYLVVNWSIDVSNSLQYSITSEYERLFGRDMYEDAMCAEIRAFAVRRPSENDTSLLTPPVDQTPRNHGQFSEFEAGFWGKLEDPCEHLEDVPATRDDASMPASAVATRVSLNVLNAGITTVWIVLCAFQTAMFYYLFFVGPVMAALWVWPVKQMRDGFKNWIEAVVTLCFWSLFWHTTVLLMACFKGVDDSGVMVMSALNFLATASVKYAFDFTGLVKAAGQEVAKIIEKGGTGGGGGAGGGTGSGHGASGGRTGRNSSTASAATAPGNIPGVTPPPPATPAVPAVTSPGPGPAPGQLDAGPPDAGNSPGAAGLQSALALRALIASQSHRRGTRWEPETVDPPPYAVPGAAPPSSHPNYQGARVMVDPNTGQLSVWNGTQYVAQPHLKVDPAMRVMILNATTGQWQPIQCPSTNGAGVRYREGELWISTGNGDRTIDPLKLFAPPPLPPALRGAPVSAAQSAITRALRGASSHRI